eukprot:97807-Hanusia_phi.AAC.1
MMRGGEGSKRGESEVKSIMMRGGGRQETRGTGEAVNERNGRVGEERKEEKGFEVSGAQRRDHRLRGEKDGQ